MIWTALQAFCGIDISALRGVGINSIDNVMTLSATSVQFRYLALPNFSFSQRV